MARRTYDVLTNKKAIQDRKILDKIRKGDQGIEKENTHQETQKEWIANKSQNLAQWIKNVCKEMLRYYNTLDCYH